MITQINTLKTLIYPVSVIFKKGQMVNILDFAISTVCYNYSTLPSCVKMKGYDCFSKTLFTKTGCLVVCRLLLYPPLYIFKCKIAFQI